MISKEGEEMTCATLNLCGMHSQQYEMTQDAKDLSQPFFLLLLRFNSQDLVKWKKHF